MEKYRWNRFEPARSLRCRDDSGQSVREILEEEVLQLDRKSKDPVEELGHVVVALVQRQHAGHVLALSDETDTDQSVGNVLKFWRTGFQNANDIL
jgi:hypothetical protein